MSSLPELNEIIYILNPLADRYFDLGIQLGVKIKQLKSIEGKGYSQSRCLTETISLWQDNSDIGECSWSALTNAVERMEGHNKLAKELKARDTQQTESCSGTQGSYWSTPGQLSPVHVEAKKEEEDPTKDSVEDSKHNCKHHDKLAKDLMAHAVTEDCKPSLRPPQHDSTESTDDTGYSSKSNSICGDSSGSEVELYDVVTGCGCCNETCSSVYRFCTSGCPNINPNGSACKEVPIVRKQSATQDLDAIEYEKKTEEIQEHFGRFITDTCRSFKKRQVDPQDLILLIRTSCPMMNKRIKELNANPSLGQVFNIVADHACSWFDYRLLKIIINYFKDDGDKRRLQEYEHHFKEYAQERLPNGKKHIIIGGGAKQGCRQLVIKIDREWKEVTFNDLDKLREIFATVLGVYRDDLYLADVREGCIMMTFMITEELAGKLFPTKNCLTSSQVKSLKDEGVISLRCGKLIWRTSSNRNVCKVDTE